MGNTPNWNIYYAENGAPADARTESATQAGTVETALDSVGGDIVSVNNFGVQYFANASARDLALTNPQVGWLSQLDSELFMRRWDGSAWRPYGAGLFPVKPSSVAGTGVSVGANGVVNFASATAVGINGVFSADFRDYRVEFTVLSTSVDTNMGVNLRRGGTNASSNYVGALVEYQGSSSGSSVPAVSNRGLLTTFNPSHYSGYVKFTAPGINTPTLLYSQMGGFPTSGAGVQVSVITQHNDPSDNSFDGFSISPETGNCTGHMRIFGVA